MEWHSLPKVIWVQGRVAAGCPGRGRCSTAPWRAFMNCKLTVSGGSGSGCQRTTGSNILLRASEFWEKNRYFFANFS